MELPYLALFGILLLLYLGYSFWHRLDPRYPVVAGLVLLVVTAITEAYGGNSEANTLVEFVFLLLVGGGALFFLERYRQRRAESARPVSLKRGAGISEEQPADPTHEG
jgi:hypothetical protein